LSIEAGINFPELGVQLAGTGPVAAHFEYTVGMTHRWAFEELLRVLRDRGHRRARLREYLKVRDLFDPMTRFTLDPGDIRPDLFRAVLGAAILLRSARKQAVVGS
jgi:hypothetical protein